MNTSFLSIKFRTAVMLMLLLPLSGCKQSSHKGNAFNTIKDKVESIVSPPKTEYTVDENFRMNAPKFSVYDWIKNNVKNLYEENRSGVEALLEQTFEKIQVQSHSILKDHEKAIKRVVEMVGNGKDISGNKHYIELCKAFNEESISAKSLEIFLNMQISTHNTNNDNMFSTVLLSRFRNDEIMCSDLLVLANEAIVSEKSMKSSKKVMKKHVSGVITNCLLYNYAEYLSKENIIEQITHQD